MLSSLCPPLLPLTYLPGGQLFLSQCLWFCLFTKPSFMVFKTLVIIFSNYN